MLFGQSASKGIWPFQGSAAAATAAARTLAEQAGQPATARAASNDDLAAVVPSMSLKDDTAAHQEDEGALEAQLDHPIGSRESEGVSAARPSKRKYGEC